MKRFLIPIILLCAVSVYAQAPVQFFQANAWLDGTTMTWTPDSSKARDTLTCTGTLKYSEPFRLTNGYLTFYWKSKFSSAGADTDTAQVNLYNSAYANTNALRWIFVDSLLTCGRADTFYQRKVFSLAGKYGIWWRLGFKKRMGVPKLIDKSRNIQ